MAKKGPKAEEQEYKEISKIYENDLEMLIDEYLVVNGWTAEDMTPNRFNAGLMYICDHLFKGNKNLRMQPYDSNNLIKGGSSNNNAYDIDKLNQVADLYIKLCYKFNNIYINIMGFSLLTGISKDALEDFKKETEPRSGLSTSGNQLYNKITNSGEQSLIGNLLDKSTNPMKSIVLLNNHYGYSSERKTIVNEGQPQLAVVSRDSLAASLGLELPDKSTN